MGVTLKQISQATGISISTVSRALTEKGYVSDEARAAIKQAMEDLGYTPRSAQMPSRPGVSDVVMIITGGLRSSISSELLEGLSIELERKNKQAFIVVSDFSAQREQAFLRYAMDHNVFGIIMLTVIEAPDTIAILRTMPCPVVFIGRYLPSMEMDFLHPDYYKMGSFAAEYLISHGHKRIAFVGGSKISTITQDKQIGLEDCLESNGITLDHDLVIYIDRLLYENGQQVADWLLALENPPTALLTSNDISVGIEDALLRAGVVLPRDLSIFSCDNTPMSGTCHVPLTVACVNYQNIATEAVRILFRRKRSALNAVRYHLLFEPFLIERDSVSEPRATSGFVLDPRT